jgi:hypothetical protein
MKKQYTDCPQPTSDELRERWTRWTQAMELSHAMLMSGLQAQVGPDGDIHAAYRAWYDRYQSLKWKDANIQEKTLKVIDAS